MFKKIALALTVFVLALVLAQTSQAGDKVTVCHSTSSTNNPVVRINISVNALASHLAHGDVLPNAYGACDQGDPVPE